MKTDRRIAIALLLLTSTVRAADPIGSSRPPEQVADLYIQAMTGNIAKANELNDYLRPAFNGNDALDVAVIEDLPNRLKELMASDLSAHIGKHDAAVDRAISTFAEATVNAIRRSPCHATGSTIGPNEYKPNELIAEVAYECRVPDVKKVIGHVQHVKASVTAATVEKMASALDATPADKTIHGTFDLYSDVQRRVWSTGSPGDVLGAVVNAIGGTDPQ